ncbi:MAG: DUF4091 domain-containing protein [Lentisphaeria bacterium]|nr:DUF4091 domain-containing protein [Lentisphaeria bacterium]
MKTAAVLLTILTALLLGARDIPLKVLSVSGGAEARLSPEGFLVIRFPAFSPELKNTHPTVTLGMPADCSGCDGVEADVRLSGGLSASLSINFRDGTGKQCYHTQTVVDNGRKKLHYKFNPARKMDLKNMKYLRIYLSRPPLPAEFTVYGLRLYNTVAARCGRLKPAAAQVGLAAELEKVRTAEQYEKILAAVREKQVAGLIANSRSFDGGTGIGAGSADALARPLPFHGTFAAQPGGPVRVALAACETENAHIVTVSAEALPFISAECVEFPAGIRVEIHPVGAVKTRFTPVPGVHAGWHFDPILEYTAKVENLRPRQLQLWVLRVTAPPGTKKGLYRGKIRFTAPGGSFLFPAEITVFGFALPRRMTLRTATSVYGSPLMGRNRRAFERWILKNFHLNGFSIYSETGSYGRPVLPPVSQYLEDEKEGLNFIPLLYLKLPRQAHHTGKGVPPGKSKELWERMTPAQQAVYPEEWKREYIEILKKRIPELKAVGLYRYAACYGFDEATPSERPAIIDLVKELRKHFPDLKIFSKLDDGSYGFGSPLAGIIDGWIPGIARYNFELAQKARKAGREVWYYTTGMTVDTEPLASTRAQVGERAFANHVDGWLVWTVSRWYGNKKPISSNAPLTGWDPESFPGGNGGGCYFCMGPDGRFLSTLRAESIRDGIEDFEYYTILKRLASKRSPEDPLRKEAEALDSSLKKAPGIDGKTLLDNRRRAAELIERMQ